MRDEIEIILKQELRLLALRTRASLHITQKEMSELLCMNEKSYSYIETGVYMCGTSTCVLLLMMQEDPKSFLDDLKIKINKVYEKEMQLV